MNTSKMLFPYYWTFSQIMVASWFIGLFIDVSIDFGDPQGFWTLRVLLPVLAMGICILKAIKTMRRNKLEFGKGGTAMLRKLNCFLNIVIGSFIGVFIGFGIYKFWHFKTYPNLYVMQSAPWYTELLLDGALVAVVVVVCIILKLIIWRKL